MPSKILNAFDIITTQVRELFTEQADFLGKHGI